MELYVAFVITIIVILGTGIFGISKIISEIKKLDE